MDKGIKYELYKNVSDIQHDKREYLKREISEVLKNAWGNFPDEFIYSHVLSSSKILLAKNNSVCIGFCSLSIKEINGIKVHYVEFLVISKEYQNGGLGSLLFYLTMKSEIMTNIISLLLGKSLEVMFITPNIRVLTRMAAFSRFIYPNPYLAGSDGSIKSADEITWIMAKYLLEHSDNPKRNLEREGLVLHNSYSSTPWLIYNEDNAPWHKNIKFEAFTKKYLGYHDGSDKEFIVRAQIGMSSILKYIFTFKK